MAFGIDDLLVVPALGSLVSGVVNTISTNKKIKNENQKAEDAINNLTFNPADFFTNYSYYDDPESYKLYTQGGTEYDNIALDPNVLYAQNQALEDLINLSEAKGLNAIDQQALQEIINEENKQIQGQNDRIIQDAMQRGVYGSGLELAQRLQNAQSGANRMSTRDMDVMSQAQKRALDALSSYGDLASNMRTQDYNEQAKRAAAQDVINASNVQNMTNWNKGNVDNLNTVRQGNVDIKNKQQDANVAGYDKTVGYNYDKAKLATGQYQNNANAAVAIGKNTNDLIGGLSEGVSGALERANKKK